MSTPINSTGPFPPSGSSNPVGPYAGFKGWFTSIIDWIKGLSPAGATVYDTGWVDITPATGFSGTSPQARRIGKAVYLRGTLGGTVGNNVTTVIGTVPTAFVPSSQTAAGVGTTGGVPIWGNVTTGGDIRLRNPAGGSTTIYLSALSGYTVD